MKKNTVLKLLIGIEVVLIVICKLFERSDSNLYLFIHNWYFWAPLAFGIFVFFYAFNIRCPDRFCNARQVFRGLSFFDIRFPGDKCYRCGANMNCSGRFKRNENR